MNEKDLKKAYRKSRLKSLSGRIGSRVLDIIGCGVEVGLHCHLGGNFKDYIFNENMPERISALKKNMDKKSLDDINIALERIKNAPNWWHVTNKTKRTYVRPDQVLTQEEKEDNKVFIENLPKFKKRYKLPFYAHSMEVFSYHCGINFLPKKTQKYIEGKDIIDGGAYIGDSALIYFEHNPKKVWSFDISEENCLYYNQTMKMNNIPKDKYELIKAGLTDKTYKSTFKENGGLGANIFGEIISDSPDNTNADSSIQFYAIDDFCVKNNLNIGFIRLDIEGFEPDVIKGSVNTILQQRPILCISIYHNPREFFELKPYIESLNAGYKFMFRRLSSMMIPKIPYSHDSWWLRHAISINETNLIAYPAELED